MSNNASSKQTLANFYSRVQSVDFARQFQFRISTLANTNFKDTENLLYLETANLPGRSITNVQVPFMGLQFNVPGTATYPGSDSWAVTFRGDANYDIRKTLENATFNTFDDSTSTGNYNIGRNASLIVLDLLDKQMKTVRQYTLYGAYVVSVGDIAYNIGDSGAIVTVPATLAYNYWRVTKSGSETKNTDSSPARTVPAQGSIKSSWFGGSKNG
jgi:hypothetical protein